MGLKTVWIVFLLSIISLLVFQAIWLYSAYNIKKTNVEEDVSLLLIKSVEEELKFRHDKFISNDTIRFVSTKESIVDTTKTEASGELDPKEIMETSFLQQILNIIDAPIQISFIDSLFSKKIDDLNISNKYSLLYKDSTGTILEQTGNLSSTRMNKAFRTDSLLIVDGKRVQAIVDISPSVVFRRMIWLLAASFLMLIILFFCIIYQAKTIFTQYKLNRLREDFTHALTHNMKTPLGTIYIVLSQFKSGVLDNKPEMKAKFSKIAMNQVSNLLRLIEKILTLAMLEEGKLILKRTQTDLSEIVDELKSDFSLSKEKQVTILTTVELDNQTIYLDKTMIKEAISNLIQNAIKYSGDSVEIKLNCYIENNQLFIRVKDNGAGISKKDRQKIFDKFERGTAVGRKGTEGFGIGLNYVKRITEAHGGIVVLHSHEKEGSEFTMLLPLVIPEQGNRIKSL
jgi:two-component system phosphate regulon sensor histidine kinase PhoR